MRVRIFGQQLVGSETVVAVSGADPPRRIRCPTFYGRFVLRVFGATDIFWIIWSNLDENDEAFRHVVNSAEQRVPS